MTIITRKRGNHRPRLFVARWVFCGAATLWATGAMALDLALPSGAVPTFRTVQDPGAYALPTAPFAEGHLPTTRIEGRIDVASWRVPDSPQSAFQLAAPLRDALAAAGFDILLDCAARDCGGFDFRFATLVLPAPEMFVDLTEFHVISARSSGGDGVFVLTSRDQAQGYIQIIRAGQVSAAAISTDAPPVVPTSTGSVIEALETKGHVVLSDLLFRSGSTALGEGSVASLDAIAIYLRDNPSRQILFVGHTDATGSLAANRRVSLKRAEAAVTYLRSRHDTRSEQIGAEGAGYLAPVASNLTEAGRKANRRVEAVLISTQ